MATVNRGKKKLLANKNMARLFCPWCIVYNLHPLASFSLFESSQNSCTCLVISFYRNKIDMGNLEEKERVTEEKALAGKLPVLSITSFFSLCKSNSQILLM